eukprot:tig00021037_g17471.t1
MIKYDAKNWPLLLIKLLPSQGSAIARTLPQSIVAAVLGTIAYFTLRGTPAVPDRMHTMLSSLIAFLIVFRSTLSYNRYWDGRFKIGAVVKDVRDLCRKVQMLIPAATADDIREKSETMRLGCLYFILLVQHLRGEDRLEDCGDFITEKEHGLLKTYKRRPLVIITMLTKKITMFARKGLINSFTFESLDKSLLELIGGFNGCDALVFTPFPFPFAQLLTIFLVFYCWSAPFILVSAFGVFTPLVSFFLTMAFFSIYETSVELEDPYGYDPNDLDLNGMIVAIQEDCNMMRVVDSTYDTAASGMAPAPAKAQLSTSQSSKLQRRDTAEAPLFGGMPASTPPSGGHVFSPPVYVKPPKEGGGCSQQ